MEPGSTVELPATTKENGKNMVLSSPVRPIQRFRPLVALLVLAVSGVISAPAASLAAPLPTFSIDDVTVTEGDAGTSTMTFTVTQSSRARTSVRFATAPGTAVSPDDFVARTGTLKYAGKHLTKKVAITIVGDTLDETNEHFSVRLSNPVGATIADDEGEGTINDNDAPPTVSSVATLTVPEGNNGDTTFASVDVTLSGPSGRHISVDFQTADGTASAGSDYTSASGTLDFPAGQTLATAVVQVLGDEDAEGDETFDVDLTNPVNATLGAHPTIVTIQDNDPIPPGSAILSVTGGSIREGSGTTKLLTFHVTRSGETTTAVSVDYATANGSALAPSDYVNAAGTIPFASGVTAATVQVQIVGDRRLEHRERFFFSLLNPSAGAAVDHGQAVGRIRDNDTWTRFSSGKKNGRIQVHGRLSPAHPGKLMAVTLTRRVSGSWVRLGVRRPTLIGRFDADNDGFSDSRFSTAFPRPRPGTCRIVVRFRGDANHGPSQARKVISC